MKPLQTGITLSVTVAIFYSLCTLVEVAFPDQFMTFMNALFHGLDFSELARSEPYSWSAFLYALVVLALWAFAIGAFFAWIRNSVEGARLHRLVQHEQP